MAVQKCKKILLQAALRDHWSSDNPKLKTFKFVKNLISLGSYWKKYARIGILGSYVCLKVI